MKFLAAQLSVGRKLKERGKSYQKESIAHGVQVHGLGSKKGAIVTVVSVVVALLVAMATIQSTQASIDFWLQKPESFQPGLNSITVFCKNGGGMDGDFNLIVKFTNATVSFSQTEMPFTRVDNSTVSVGKFVLHKEETKEQTIWFYVDQTEAFSVSVSLEKASLTEFLKANALFPTQLRYSWNGACQVFNCTNLQ
jgi:hypothetical protein